MKQSNVVKKLSIWLGAITFLFGACALPIFTFINTAKADGLGTLQSNTQKQTIANVMSQCVDAVYQAQQAYLANGGTVEDMQEWYYTSDGGRPFGGIDNVTVSTGYGTGQAITGYMTSSVSCNSWNTDDFSSDVLTSFAQSVGKSDTMDIICNGDNPGIMKLQYRDGNGWKDASGACRNQPDPNTEYRYVWNDQRAAESYLNKLYDGDWYSVGNFDKSQDYYRYYEEYRTVCVNPSNNGVVITSTLDEVAPNIDTSDLGPKIPWYRDDGTVEYHQYHQKDNTKSWGMSGLASGLGGASNCNDLAGIINGDGRGEDIDNRLAEAKKEEKRKSCLQKIDDLDGLTRTAQGIVDQDRHTPGTIPAEVVKNAQRVINKRFWEEDAKGEITCWIPDLSSGGSTTVKPPETPNTPSDEPSPDGGNSSNNGNGEGSGGSDLAGCFEADSALTWVLCPTLQVVGLAADWFYGEISDNWLPVEANLVANNSAVYNGWSNFRDIANILFAAMLLIVIFSQLTGFGVSNYGIKKMLPSLIVTVVLVNISFLICQVIVDLVNIFGAEIGKFMASLGQLPNSDLDGTMASVGKHIVGYLFSSIGIVGIGSVAVGAVKVLGAKALISVLIPVLIAVVGALISLFFLFLLLAIRKAGILAAIMLAPVAIIAYALPNTKNLFDKWKKLFTGLLLVYPICQVISGGGQMMASIMLATNGGGMLFYVTAMLLQVVPVFFVPTLLRNSMSALGNVGTRISQMGDRWRNRAVSTMNNSDMAKQARINRQYANALRPKATHKLNERLRNMRGVGRVVRGVEDSRFGRGIGQAMNDSRTRRNARAISAYRDTMLSNAKAQNIAEHTTDQSIAEEVDAMNYKYQQSLIDNAATTMQLGNMTYTDENGNEQTINVNDADKDGSLDQALQYYMKQYDATGDEEMLIKAEV